MRLKKAIEEYLEYLESKERSDETIRGYGLTLKEVMFFLENRQNCAVYLDEIMTKDLESYLNHLKDRGSQAVSRNRARSVIRSFYVYLQKRELIRQNVSLNLESAQVRQKERDYLTESEIRELSNTIDHPIIKAAVITLANTGLRINELCKLTLSDVDFEIKLIKVRQGKGNKDRTIPINEKLNIVLMDYLLKDRPFTNTDNFFATTVSGRLSRQTVNHYLKRTVDDLGWHKHVTAHILRHSFATNLLCNDVSLPVIQKLMGHSDLRVTSRYLHQDLKQLHEAVNRL